MACACLNWNATQRSCLSRGIPSAHRNRKKAAERMASKVRYGEVWDRKAVNKKGATPTYPLTGQREAKTACYPTLGDCLVYAIAQLLEGATAPGWFSIPIAPRCRCRFWSRPLGSL